MNISIDGAPVAQLKAPRFTVVDVAPGPHECHAAFSGGAAMQNRSCSVPFVAAAGSLTVLKVSVSLGMLKNEVVVAPVPLDSVRVDIERATMVAPDRVA